MISCSRIGSVTSSRDGSWAIVYHGVRARGSSPEWHVLGRETFADVTVETTIPGVWLAAGLMRLGYLGPAGTFFFPADDSSVSVGAGEEPATGPIR